MANISSGATVPSTYLLVDDDKSFVGTIAHLHRKNSDITYQSGDAPKGKKSGT